MNSYSFFVIHLCLSEINICTFFYKSVKYCINFNIFVLTSTIRIIKMLKYIDSSLWSN